jgi:hypothetical protein
VTVQRQDSRQPDCRTMCPFHSSVFASLLFALSFIFSHCNLHFGVLGNVQPADGVRIAIPQSPESGQGITYSGKQTARFATSISRSKVFAPLNNNSFCLRQNSTLADACATQVEYAGDRMKRAAARSITHLHKNTLAGRIV